jgi:DNA-binding CsgD family transcriptional regulator
MSLESGGEIDGMLDRGLAIAESQLDRELAGLLLCLVAVTYAPGAKSAVVEAAEAALALLEPLRPVLEPEDLQLVDRMAEEFDLNRGERHELAIGLIEAIALGRRTLERRKGGAPSRVTNPHRLTPRELDVLRLLAGGNTNAEIASALQISDRTVERHISNIYGKIGARGRADATAYAIAQGFADQSPA